MSNLPPESASGGVASRLRRPIEVIVVSSVMFTFISCWRTAAIVLCDLASTAYYIGGIVEGANNPLFAVVNTARILQAQEVILGGSNKYTADEQFEQIALYWMNVGESQMTPLTVRLLSRQRDICLDLAGGNRIPKISERRARSVDELRSAGVGIGRALFVHSGTVEGSDLFKAVLTMLDPGVALSMASLSAPEIGLAGSESWIDLDMKRAEQLHREVDLHGGLPEGNPAQGIVQLAECESYDVILIGQVSPLSPSESPALDVDYVIRHAPCWVCLIAPTAISRGTVEDRKTG